ncbi:hypothetical protein A2841_01350 [Candidatus Kaiserbacteria bacterium RIFCSPHIGHO2_01_FULL_48_10]|uniref:Uncharacterized protein n=1 Tax=Candidatus Kaiserbacteria bacterium RIFCSPHIGHO2_01_FULL_48_10 TaxID=1798476 RepID=A0A1F6C2H7_9BACT|nr:MAG: hypothetical protein A2841_01350 [Candidatus Kaiserbacteria bacterium RIFCSPHIGHO2_01_FULL_48_10]HLC99530.1 hypothetical protein [Patescibacteria group bacterium]
MANQAKSSKEPEDILEEVDTPRKNAEQRRARALAGQGTTPSINSERQLPSSSGHRLPFIVGGVVAIFLLLGAAGFVMLSQKGNNTDQTSTNTSGSNANTNQIGASNTNTAANTNAGANINALRGTPSDTDGDGLSNSDEAKAGTDQNNPDTDGDGLSDREEVQVWKTNPLKADTDDDGFKDGDEIRQGFDPKVAGGKLLDLQKAIQQLNVNK